MMQSLFNRLLARVVLRSSLLLAILVLAACGPSTVVLNGSYPAPLSRKLPITVGIYYPPELRNHTYTEIDDNTGKDEFIVQSGAAQLQLFNTLLPAMFRNTLMLDSLDAARSQSGIDAVLIPTVAEFQMGLPQKTKLKVFEIWLKYNIKLTKPNGDQIADWVMTAYGKAPDENLQSVNDGLQSASNVAMRDLAASFTLGFANVPDVKEWLRANNLDK